MTVGLPINMLGHAPSGITNFVQGALGGGGYALGFAAASDGSQISVRNDTANGYIWSRSTNKWRNVCVTPGMANITGASTVYEIAFAPTNSNRIYMVAVRGQVENYSNNGRGVGRSYLWTSSDGGQTWSVNTTTPLSGTAGSASKFSGPHMAVDPNNADVVYVISASAAVYVSYDGGVTLTLISDLLAALPSATATANSGAGNGSFTVNANPISGLSGYNGFNATHPYSLGVNNTDDNLSASSTTTFGVTEINPQNPAQSGFVAGVSIGDTIYFGRGGCIAIDASASTKANPGGSGVISNVVYVAWQIGPSNLWRTTDGGTSWAAMSGGPPNCPNKMRISPDGVLYVADGSVANKYYRWVGASAPGGSGLSTNTWTQITITVGGNLNVIEPHPTIAGKCCAMNLRTGCFVSTDWGTNFSAYPGAFINTAGPPGLAPNGTDVPWMSYQSNVCQDYFSDDCIYDRVTVNKLWITTGIGVGYVNLASTGTAAISGVSTATNAVFTLAANDWVIGDAFTISGLGGAMGTALNGTTAWIQNIVGSSYTTNINTSTLSFSSGGTATFLRAFTSLSAGMDSLTVTTIRKAPAPNGNLFVGCEDRPFFTLTDVATYPPSYYFSQIGIDAAIDIKPSDSDPTAVWAAKSTVYQSTNSGTTWAAADTTTRSVNVNNISNAVNAVITTASSTGWKIGESFVIHHVGGSMGTSINGLVAKITNISGSTITTNIDASGFAAYTSGGDLQRGLYSMLAATSPTSCVQAPEDATADGDQGAVQYTTDAGVTWQPSSFGSAGCYLIGSGGGPFQGCRHTVCSDSFGNYYYWDPGNTFNINSITNDATGATFTLARICAPGQQIKVGGISGEQLAISGITLDATGAVITLSSTTHLSVGMTFVVSGISVGTTQANGVTFTITAITPTGGLTAGQVKTNKDSSGWTAYISGGSAAVANNMTQANGVTFTITSVSPNGQVKTNIDSSTWGVYISGGFVTLQPAVWKSTDGGANFTKLAFALSSPFGITGGCLIVATPGVAGHLWMCPGILGGLTINTGMYRTTDDGVTWTLQSQANDQPTIQALAFGKAKPGNSYPTMYIVGQNLGANYGIYRCDNPDSATRVYTKLSLLTNVNNDNVFGGLSGDMDVYGTVYVGTGSSGYLKGTLS